MNAPSYAEAATDVVVREHPPSQSEDLRDLLRTLPADTQAGLAALHGASQSVTELTLATLSLGTRTTLEAAGAITVTGSSEDPRVRLTDRGTRMAELAAQRSRHDEDSELGSAMAAARQALNMSPTRRVRPRRA
jgi:hypothetical protein